MADALFPGRILVVDDEPVNLLVLKGVLGKAGYEVECASSGRQCLEMARILQPDVILLDVMMPGESGFETCRKLKADPATTHVPVMFITSLGQMSDKLQGLDIGAVDYITKPFMAAEVLARVRAQMSFQSRQREVISAQASRLDQVQAAQRALLARPEDQPQARFAVHFLPVLEAGGDFYDVLEIEDGRHAYFMADVSGHDLGASFLTPSLKALFRQHAAKSGRPLDILAGMNAILYAITSEEVYMTASCLLIDRKSWTYTLASAAHPPALACGKDWSRSIRVSGQPLGMFQDAEFDSVSGEALPGQRFYLYTDGLAENVGLYVTSENFHHRLAESSLRSASLGLEDAVRSMAQELGAQGPAADDVVLMGVEA